MNKRKSILSDIEKNYADTKSISKTVDITSLENGVNPHTIYKDVFKKVDNKTPNDFPTEKISVGDIVYTGNNPNKQYEVITINNKNNIVIKDLSTNEVIETNENNIKKIMENIDMAKKKINETQYSVSINGLETTDANALSQMMSAAAQADSGNADVGGMDMTSTPELPTPEMGAMDPAVNEPITSVESIPPAEDSIETVDEEPSFEDSDIEGMDDELPTDIENPLDNPKPEMDSFEDDFEPVVDDIEFDEEITPTEDELEMDIEEPVENDLGINESQMNESRPDTEQLDEYNTNLDKVDPRVLQELYDVIIEVRGPEFLADDNEVDYEEIIDAVKDFGNEIEGFDPKYATEYAYKLKEKCSEEYCCPNCGEYNENGLDSECPNCGYNPNENEEDEEINEDILLPKATEDETFVAKKKLENDKEDEDEESERISESMEALIKSILESADAKSEQEIYAEEISEEAGDESSLSDEKNIEIAYNEDINRSVGYDNEGGSYNSISWKKKEVEESKQPKRLLPNNDDWNYIEGDVVSDKNGNKWTIKHIRFFGLRDDDVVLMIDSPIHGHIEKTEPRVRFEKLYKPVEENSEDEKILDEDNDDLDTDIAECLKSAGIQLDESNDTSNPSKSLKRKLEDIVADNGYTDYDGCELLFNCMNHESQMQFLRKHNYEDLGYAYDDNRELAFDLIYAMNDEELSKCKELFKRYFKPLKESIVKPTIVTDESSFANKPNKALKPEDKKNVKKKTVDTATFGKNASEGFKEPLNCIKCEAVSPKDKIKAIYETAKTRYANADKEQWNALDRRYIRKLIESGCGYTRASKIILEAKKKK